MPVFNTVFFIVKEDLAGNAASVGGYFLERLRALQDRQPHVGDVRGKGLFCGAELVTDRATKEPVPEKQVQAVVADCMAPRMTLFRLISPANTPSTKIPNEYWVPACRSRWPRRVCEGKARYNSRRSDAG